jgi:hypothetical protein
MPSSAARTFTDPDDYAAAIRATKAELTVTGRGKFTAKLTRIDLHRLWMQRFSDNLPRVGHSAATSGRAIISRPVQIPRNSAFGVKMRYKLAIIAGALIVIGAAAAGALYYAHPVQVSTLAALTRNYLISWSAPPGTVTVESNAAYKGAPAVAPSPPAEAASAGATAGDWPSYNRTLSKNCGGERLYDARLADEDRDRQGRDTGRRQRHEPMT